MASEPVHTLYAPQTYRFVKEQSPKPLIFSLYRKHLRQIKQLPHAHLQYACYDATDACRFSSGLDIFLESKSQMMSAQSLELGVTECVIKKSTEFPRYVTLSSSWYFFRDEDIRIYAD